jgi:type IV pilus assembly protein PilZ
MNSFFADYTKNISKGGTFIKSTRPLPVGTSFVFSLTVPALSEPVNLTGEVTWLISAEEAERRGQDPGMGIRFRFEDEKARRTLEELVARMMDESLGPDATRALLHREENREE